MAIFVYSYVILVILCGLFDLIKCVYSEFKLHKMNKPVIKAETDLTYDRN
ncbi:MAG: hypothetical protein ACI38A_02795 [Candidatus Ornithomonoglobus sp.]